MTADAHPIAASGRHHLDRRADHIAQAGVAAGDADDLLNTRTLADWLGVSVQFLEIGRHRGYGPPFIRLSTRRVRYKRSDVLDWLAERTHAVTAEYGRDRPLTSPRQVPRFVRRRRDVGPQIRSKCKNGTIVTGTRCCWRHAASAI